MTDSATAAAVQANGVLRRKVQTMRAASLDEFAMTPGRALTQALAQAGQALRLMIDVADLRELRMTLAELPELLDDHALLAVIEGPEEGLGLCALSPAVMSALIEVQTTGRVLRGEPAPRRPTRTDAAMCTDSIDTVLRELEATLDQTDDRTWSYGFRFASFLADPRPLSLLLEETRYRVFVASLAMADGARKGGIVLAFPAEGRAPALRVTPQSGQTYDDEVWIDGLGRAVRAASADLRAVLCRLTLPLADVMALQPGQQLTFPMDRLGQVRLEGAGGVAAAISARLGQFRGYRALRLTGEDASEQAPDENAGWPVDRPPSAAQVSYRDQDHSEGQPSPGTGGGTQENAGAGLPHGSPTAHQGMATAGEMAGA